MRRQIYRFFIIAFFYTITFSTLCFSADKTVLKVAFPEAAGMNETHEDGSHSGMFYDFLIEISKYTGWSYEFYTGDTQELIDKLSEGELDIMGGMFYFEQLESHYIYPKNNTGYSYTLILSRKDDPTINSYNLNTMNGKTIGVRSVDKKRIEKLKQYLSFNNLSCEIVPFDTKEEYEACLENRQVDMMLSNNVQNEYEYNVITKFHGEPLYIVTNKYREDLIEPLDEALELIYAANPYFAEELYQKYYPEIYQNSIEFNQAEQQYLAQTKTLPVVLMQECFPLSYVSYKNHKGVTQDIFDMISEKTGLHFEFTYVKTYQEALEMVNHENTILMGQYLDSDETAMNLEMISTKPYMKLEEVILKNKHSSADKSALIVAVVQGQETTVDFNYPVEIQYYSSFLECAKAVNRGNADYSCIPSSFIDDIFNQGYLANVTILTTNSLYNNVSIAISRNMPTELYSILSKAVNNITPDEVDSILSNHLVSVREKKLTIESLIYSNPMASLVVSCVFIFLVAMIFFTLRISHVQSKLMQTQLEKAKETSKAKSDFLSRMSHEIRTPINAIIGLTRLNLMTNPTSKQLTENLTKIESSSQFLLALVNDILDMSKIESQKMTLAIQPFSIEELSAQLEDMVRLQAQQKNIQLIFDYQVSNPQLLGDPVRLKQILINLLSNALKFTDSHGEIRLIIHQKAVANQAIELYFSVKDTGIGIAQTDIKRIFQAFEQTEISNRSGQGTGLGLSISSSLVHLMGSELKVISEEGVGTQFYFTLWLPIYYGTLPSQALRDTSNTVHLEGIRLLLAEDNDINAEIAISLLELKGIVVDRVKDGKQAVTLFIENPVHYYQAILMDIQMPVMNGLQATQEIRRSQKQDANNIPIIAMTANTFEEDQQNAYHAGMDAFLSKPFQVEQLYQILQKYTCQKDS